jgi:DNA-binding NarL/FixJ family response regulator
MNGKIRVLLVEDEVIVAEAIGALLELEERIEVVGIADSAAAAVRKVRVRHPDVILLDMGLPDRSGVAALPDLLAKHPAARIVMLTAYADEANVAAAFQAGAVGFVLKTQAVTELVRAIEQAVQGQSSLPPTVAPMMLRQFCPQGVGELAMGN